MVRTLDPEAHTLRRDEFVDAALRLMQTNGWDATSIQDVLVGVGASKGAFYHYFDSKAALLDAVIERIGDAAVATLRPVVEDPDLSSPEKLDRMFVGLARWKGERTELILAVLQIWTADDNAIVRERFRQGVVQRLAPLLAEILGQGQAEGRYSGIDPDDAARVLVSLIQGANDATIELYFARQADAIPFEVVERRLGAYRQAFERVLDLPAGSLAVTDRQTLLQWFG